MKKLMMTVAIVIGMIAATFGNEKEVKLMLDNNKLHYSYYSPSTYEGIVIDKTSHLILKTDQGLNLVFSVDYNVTSQKGYKSESITISFDLTDEEVELLKKVNVVEMKLQHSNGVQQITLDQNDNTMS